ncbi:MAG: helix-turn-helix transcriptional regulator [Verrucomicrobiales bacterium]
MNHATPGQRIKATRIERKMTQEKLVQLAGISVGFLSDLENDKTNVGADKLLDIAEALDVSLDYLMKGEDSNQPPKMMALELPASLVRLADRAGLTVTQVRQLMGMRQQLIGFRSDTKNTDLESFDWEKLYVSVKDFLK